MWFKLDDGWLMHAKTRSMGLCARALWLAACNWSGQQLTDGFIPQHMLLMLAAGADLPVAEISTAASRLVQIGAWHEIGDDCRCMKGRKGCTCHGSRSVPDEPGWIVHDFLEYNPCREQVLADRAKSRRKREIRSTQFDSLRQAVRARDGDQCRYCARRVFWTGPDSKTNQGATFDHVDPMLGTTEVNVVVACRTCNSSKKDRTPQEANMRLRPQPGVKPLRRKADDDSERSRSAPAPAATPDPVSRSVPELGKADADPPRGRSARSRDAAPSRARPGARRAVPVPVVPVVARRPLPARDKAGRQATQDRPPTPVARPARKATGPPG